MPIIKWNQSMEPFDEMDRFMRRFGENDISSLMNAFTPAVNVYETKKEVVVETPLAGVKPEDVSISIVNDILTIKGSSEKKTEVDEKNYYRKEVQSGSFYRTVSLPSHVEGDKAEATSEDGMLKITIPKAKAKEAKEIRVKVSKSKKNPSSAPSASGGTDGSGSSKK